MRSITFGLALLGLGLVAGHLALSGQAIRSALAHETAAQPKAATGAKPHDHGQDKPHAHGAGEAHAHPGHDEAEEGMVKLSPEQIAAARIEVAPAGPGTLALHVMAPGIVQPDPDRLARIAGRVVGTVTELRKRLGDRVEKGEIVASLDSREVAEAKSEYFAARTNLEFQQTLYEREKALWDKRISSETQYLRSRNVVTEARLRGELAIQKLQALGVTEEDIAALAKRTEALRASLASPAGARDPARIAGPGLQRYTIRSPIAGEIVERLVNLGAPMGGEGEAKELYVVADLSTVWVELALPIADLAAIRRGESVSITAGDRPAARARIVFVSPLLNPETRSARVVASLPNDGIAWRPGAMVTATITTAEDPVAILLPKTALQTVGGEEVVFVRNQDGFEKRDVTTGRSDDASVEILSGIKAGEAVATANSFILKAELGKAEAEHVH